MPAYAVMREGDVLDVRVAAWHVAGDAVVSRVLCQPFPRVEAARLRRMAAEALLSIERDGILRSCLGVQIMTRDAAQLRRFLVAGALAELIEVPNDRHP